MFDGVTKDVLSSPQQLLTFIDTFWRTHTATRTRDIVADLSYANGILLAHAIELNKHVLRNKVVDTYESTFITPWLVLPLYRNNVVQTGDIEYGDDYEYSVVPEIRYGESLNVDYLITLGDLIHDVKAISDSPITATRWLSPSGFTFNKERKTITFSEDPFTIFPVYVDGASNSDFVLLWLKNTSITYNWLYQYVGRVVGFAGLPEVAYDESMKVFWKIIQQGASEQDIKKGLSLSLARPVAVASEEVTAVTALTYHTVITTDQHVYTVPAPDTATCSVGDALAPGDSVTSSLRWFSADGIIAANEAILPGLTFSFTDAAGSFYVTFPNKDVNWTYVAARPSEWRFTVYSDNVERFWSLVEANEATYGSLQTIVGLTPPGPGPVVNPARFVAAELLGGRLQVGSVVLKPGPLACGFYDRAKEFVCADNYFILHQLIGTFSDSLDTQTATSDTAVAFYNIAATLDSLSTPDLNDYTPLVTCS